ncbi:MAG: DoxX family protein [Corynebacterium sp.]|uniref:DoxX family protein n=1 Tax=Corynebacterium sp. TaxID=1720 RepID=UPI0026DF7874|nr:DoxX family protein [Corynebacterium sp.]MDO5670043.1 DoxX family protein [Corynebacterium sp.]
MTDKNLNPDRAGSYDADGLDVPTYNKDTPATDPAPRSSGSGSTPLSKAEPAGTPEPTTQFSQTSGGLFDRSGRAAPQEIKPAEPTYADEDFAPTGSHETVAYDRPAEPVPVAAPVDYETSTAVTEEPLTPDYRRGTMDFGLLIIRLLLGAWLILEAVGTFFRLGGNPGLSGLETEYANYLAPGGLAIIVPSLQLAAGVFLVLGLITPLFAMVATIVTSFTALHELTTSGAGANIFAWPETVWLSLVLLGISLALQFTGPGLVSLDFGRSWARRPLVSSWIFILLAIAGAVALWWFGAGVNPLA